jgi:hypothetical protein
LETGLCSAASSRQLGNSLSNFFLQSNSQDAEPRPYTDQPYVLRVSCAIQADEY